MKPKIIFFILLVLSSCSLGLMKRSRDKRALSSIDKTSTSLSGFLRDFNYQITGNFNHLSSPDLHQFKEVLTMIDSGRAEHIAIDEFSVHEFAQKRIICLTPKKNQGQGIFCINQDAEYYHLAAAPHPVIDRGSAPIALKAFVGLSFRYLFISSSSRCLSDKYSTCSGMTSVCGQRERYRKSDPAHNIDHYFHQFSKYHHQQFPDAYHIQFHACGEKSCPSKLDHNILARLSVGSKDVLAASALSNKLARVMNEKIQMEGSKVLSCNKSGEESYRLCASTNVQGRYLNDQRANSCTEGANADDQSTFLHIEINHDLRNDTGEDDPFTPDFLIQSLRKIR